jgi:hypothetical protein
MFQSVRFVELIARARTPCMIFRGPSTYGEGFVSLLAWFVVFHTPDP